MSGLLRIPSPKDFVVLDGEPVEHQNKGRPRPWDQSAARRTKNVDDKLVDLKNGLWKHAREIHFHQVQRYMFRLMARKYLWRPKKARSTSANQFGLYL